MNPLVPVALGLIGINLLALAVGTADLGPYAQVANYGILGLITVGFFTGRIVSDKHYAAMKDDRDQSRGELVALRVKMDEQLIPALTRVTDVMARMVDRGRSD